MFNQLHYMYLLTLENGSPYQNVNCYEWVFMHSAFLACLEVKVLKGF